MKIKYLLGLLIFSLFIASCSSRFKSTQTPDDLYYSPTESSVKVLETKRVTLDNKDDNFLQRKINNRTRWNSIDDYSYWQDSRMLGCNGFNNQWNNTWGNCNSCCNNFSYQNNFWGNNFWQNNFYNPFSNTGFLGFNNPASCFVAYYHPQPIRAFSNNTALTYSNPKFNNSNYTRDYKTGYIQGQNANREDRLRTIRSGRDDNRFSNPTRTFESGSRPSSNAGGNSGGFNSRGSNTSRPRG